ncbi:hypothetical protein GCM10011354_21450 [Egicoccus halophilus]|uniref:Uncharacterized protein n=1 Tax=Egicoccus halophilus TaxID=1670830 RepID=A0A8J3EUC8_9ACTN|nr:hypothetical protein GCM10011354_21450 [Egicoccus halophilus]
MVGNGEQVRCERRRTTVLFRTLQQVALRGLFGVPREQRPAVLPGHAQHDRAVVELRGRMSVGATRVRAEHLQPEVTERDAVTGRRPTDRHAPRPGGRHQRGEVWRVGAHGAQPDRTDPDTAHHLGGPADVVGVRMGDDQQVERAPAVAVQPVGGATVLPRIDQHPGLG